MIRAAAQVSTVNLDAAVAEAATFATNAAASAASAEAAANNAPRYNYSFATIAEMNAVTTALDYQTASVAEDQNYYRSIGGVWALFGPNETAAIASISQRFSIGVVDSAAPGNLMIKSRAGYALAKVPASALRTLARQAGWIDWGGNKLVEGVTGGAFVRRNQRGYVLRNYDKPSAAAAVSAATDTVDHVASALTDQVGSRPLLVGEGVMLTVGESSARFQQYKAAALDAICTQMGTPKPAGATVADAVWFHNAMTAEELLGQWDEPTIGGRKTIDDAFAAGAEYISGIGLFEMANDMLQVNSADKWEADLTALIARVTQYGRQKFLGTTPGATYRDPPVSSIMDTSWSNGSFLLDIPWRLMEMSRRIFNFGVAAPNYIYISNDNRHYPNVGEPNYNDDRERKRICAYLGLYDYWWHILGRKYHPAQVTGGWFDGPDAFLTVEMPHPPLVNSTALVSAIADNGLEAFDPAGAPVTITGLSIVGGQHIKVSKASGDWAGYGIQGGNTATTPGTAGRVTGPRLTYHDSSPYLIDIGEVSLTHLYSPLMPFKRIIFT